MDSTQTDANDGNLETNPTTPATKDFGDSWKKIDEAADKAKKYVESTPSKNDELTKEMKSMETKTYINKADAKVEVTMKNEDLMFDKAIKNIQELVEKTSHFPFQKYINDWQLKVKVAAGNDEKIITNAKDEMAKALVNAEKTLGNSAALGSMIEKTGNGLLAKAGDNAGMVEARETIAKAVKPK